MTENTLFQCPKCGKTYPAFKTRQERLKTLKRIGKNLFELTEPTCPDCGETLEERRYKDKKPYKGMQLSPVR